MYFDSYYFILVVPTLILSMWAQMKVSSTFNKYSRIGSRGNMSSQDVARNMMRKHGITDVSIERVGGKLTDHYDPSSKTLRLSSTVYGYSSIAAIGVAAHEAGHAVQHATSYGPLGLRSFLVPVANIGSMAGPYLAMAGLLFGFPLLLQIGIILFSGAVAFYLITLPVEFNASRRALISLRDSAVLSDEELKGARKVLSAAALTYVASALTAMASLLRLILLSQNRRRN